MASYRILKNRTRLLVVAMVLFTSLGNILLSMGMSKLGEVNIAVPGSLMDAFLHTVTSLLVWLGIFCLLLYFASYLLALSWADYSYVMPASAVGYPVVTFLGFAVLHEKVSIATWMGVTLICLGVLLVERTPLRTTEGN